MLRSPVAVLICDSKSPSEPLWWRPLSLPIVAFADDIAPLIVHQYLMLGVVVKPCCRGLFVCAVMAANMPLNAVRIGVF